MASSASSQIVVVLLSWLQLFCLLHQSIINPAAASSGDSTAVSITRKFAYPDFKDKEKTDFITLLGNADVDSGPGVVRIPGGVNGASLRDLTNQSGRVLYSFPFKMMDPETKALSSFDTSFSFRIHKLETGANKSSDSGLTFLIAPDELTVGRNGGWLGMVNDACDDNYKPFAVEFDTFENAEFHDPNDHHVGINLGSIVSEVTADPHSVGVSLHNSSILRAWISYDSARLLVDVRIAKEGGPKPLQPLISEPLDLSKIFKEYMFVGFSASTGSTPQVHSILSWHFSSDRTEVLRIPDIETCVTRLLPTLVENKHTLNAFTIVWVATLVATLAVLSSVCITSKRRNATRRAAKFLPPKERPRPLHQPRRFSLEEISEATRLFNEGEVLGFGSHGIFFEGLLADNSQVAIKRYSPKFFQQVRRSDQKKLSKEVALLSRLQHPNLVPLRGWCLDEGEFLVMYEYMPNGSLDDWLFFSGRRFPWARRFKVVKEVASALAFLHSGWEREVVHKNVKASNVLLDLTFKARLGDFGLNSQTTGIEVVSSVTHKEGTSPSSCVPPELGQVREPTKEMDVYSFGVMVLEIVSGVQAAAEGGGRAMVEWVWSLEQAGRLEEAIDVNVVRENRVISCVEEAKRVARTGLLCTQEEEKMRPCMQMVLQYLNGEACMPLLSRRKNQEADKQLQRLRRSVVFCGSVEYSME